MRLGRPVRVIGAGLAGSQAALTIARLGGDVVLDEMRPARQTPAHRTALAADWSAANARIRPASSAPGLLKQELRLLDSELIGSRRKRRCRRERRSPSIATPSRKSDDASRATRGFVCSGRRWMRFRRTRSP